MTDKTDQELKEEIAKYAGDLMSKENYNGNIIVDTAENFMEKARQKEKERINRKIDELKWMTPHCDFCMNQKLVVSPEELKQEIENE